MNSFFTFFLQKIGHRQRQGCRDPTPYCQGCSLRSTNAPEILPTPRLWIPTSTTYPSTPGWSVWTSCLQPRVYGLPALRHIGKREAEAEPEAEVEAEAQYLNYYGTPASTYPVTYGYPTAYTGYPAMKVYTGYPTTTAYTGYPATTAYTGYPRTTAYTGYPATTAYNGYPFTYNTLPTTVYNRYPYTYGAFGYNPYKIVKTPVVKN